MRRRIGTRSKPESQIATVVHSNHCSNPLGAGSSTRATLLEQAAAAIGCAGRVRISAVRICLPGIGRHIVPRLLLLDRCRRFGSWCVSVFGLGTSQARRRTRFCCCLGSWSLLDLDRSGTEIVVVIAVVQSPHLFSHSERPRLVTLRCFCRLWSECGRGRCGRLGLLHLFPLTCLGDRLHIPHFWLSTRGRWATDGRLGDGTSRCFGRRNSRRRRCYGGCGRSCGRRRRSSCCLVFCIARCCKRLDLLDLLLGLLGILATLVALAVEILKRLLDVLLVPDAGLVVSPRRQVIVDGHIAVLARPLLARDPHVRHAGQCRSCEGPGCRRSAWQSRIRDKRRRDGRTCRFAIASCQASVQRMWRRKRKERGMPPIFARFGRRKVTVATVDPPTGPCAEPLSAGRRGYVTTGRMQSQTDSQRGPTATDPCLPCSGTNTRIRPLHRQHLPAPRPSCPSCPGCTRSHLAVRLRNSDLPRRIAAPFLDTTSFLSTILKLRRPLLAR